MAEVFVIGHSHIYALEGAIHWGRLSFAHPLTFISLHEAENIHRELYDDRRSEGGGLRLTPELRSRLNPQATRNVPRLIVASLYGNVHNNIGLMQHPRPFDVVLPEQPDLPLVESAEIIPYDQMFHLILKYSIKMINCLEALLNSVDGTVIHLESPPPIGDDDFVRANMDEYFKNTSLCKEIAPRWLRYKLWRISAAVVEAVCRDNGVAYLPSPRETMDAEGFLRPEGYPDNATHGNEWYGEYVMAEINAIANQLDAA